MRELPHQPAPTSSAQSESPRAPLPAVALPDTSNASAEALAAQVAQALATQTVIHLSQNAKGRAQFELRLPYPSGEAAKAQVRQDVDDLIAQIRQAVQDAHLLLASDDER